MPDPCSYDYAIVRVVPRVERDEFVNVGVIVISAGQDYLTARLDINEQRLLAIDPILDMALVKSHLHSIPAICAGGASAGPIGRLPLRQRFDWLVAPRSTMIQISAVHAGHCTDLETMVEHLLDTMVRPIKPVSNIPPTPAPR